jgi:hypothetical protein
VFIKCVEGEKTGDGTNSNKCTGPRKLHSHKRFLNIVEGEKTGDGISYASHVKNPNPLKARATTFYDPVHSPISVCLLLLFVIFYQ